MTYSFSSELLNTPAAMQAFLVDALAAADAPVRGTELKAAVRAAISDADAAVMQAPRSSGRAESVWSNCVARGLRRLKERGSVVMAGSAYELSDAAREAWKQAR